MLDKLLGSNSCSVDPAAGIVCYRLYFPQLSITREVADSTLALLLSCWFRTFTGSWFGWVHAHRQIKQKLAHWVGLSNCVADLLRVEPLANTT